MLRVSIVVPTKNRLVLLRRALASVATQTFKDVEVIVVDDGEGAEQVSAAFPDLSIRTVANAPKKGGASARNKGIQEARAKRILAALTP